MSLLSTPLSLYSIPVAYFMAFYPHNAKFSLIARTVGWNNLDPRSHNQETLVKKGMAPELAAKVDRMAAAHQNGNETFPLWAVAVLAANFAGVDTCTLNTVSGGFVLARLLFNYIYINQTTPTASWLRTLTFFSSISLPMYLLVKAGNKLCLA
ncbi:hypothetical protein BU17DRAFT_48853 [Hysterangium stoloniferum]|nr:hypothetical protein BU17DRAFT_48853 [Hysterangium stoloniferum]